MITSQEYHFGYFGIPMDILENTVRYFGIPWGAIACNWITLDTLEYLGIQRNTGIFVYSKFGKL